MRRLFLLLLAAGTAAAQPDPPETARPDVGRLERRVDLVHYVVEGRTARELAASLRERGPRSGGHRFFGQAAWTLSAEYRWVQYGTSCHAEDLVVRVVTTLTLPQWDPPPGTDPALVAAWERFARALEAHERGHQRIIEEGAEALRAELASLRLVSCEGAEARARAIVDRIVGQVNDRNRRYDEQTHHGASEGAVWPPRGSVATW